MHIVEFSRWMLLQWQSCFGFFTPWNAGFEVSGQHVASIFMVNQFQWRFRYVLSKSRNKHTLYDAETQKTAISVHKVFT